MVQDKRSRPDRGTHLCNSVNCIEKIFTKRLSGKSGGAFPSTNVCGGSRVISALPGTNPAWSRPGPVWVSQLPRVNLPEHPFGEVRRHFAVQKRPRRQLSNQRTFASERGGNNSKQGRLPESQGQNLAWTVLYVPYSLDSEFALFSRRKTVYSLHSGPAAAVCQPTVWSHFWGRQQVAVSKVPFSRAGRGFREQIPGLEI